MAKSKRFLNLIFVPHSRSRVVSKQLSYRSLKVFAILSLLLVGFVIVLAANYGRVYLKALKVEILERRNAELESQHRKIGQLEKEIAILREESAKVKAMLGLDKFPEMVDLSSSPAAEPEEVGVGGEEPSSPKGSSPEMASLFGEQERTLGTIPFLFPVNGWITRTYSPSYRAIDIAAPFGTPVLASADGVVAFSGWVEELGNLVKIRHGEGLATAYGNCSRLIVKRGDLVRRGEVIGFVGLSRKNTLVRLHYQVYLNGSPVNPQDYLSR